MNFWGHSENNGEIPEALRDHLQRVAETTATFAEEFGQPEQARATGMLHDLGKYADQFQRRVKGERERGRDHAAAGAICAASIFGKLGMIPALAIEGHHRGLPMLENNPQRYLRRAGQQFEETPDRFTSTDLVELRKRFLNDGLSIPTISSGLTLGNGIAADMLDVRMLFSALVDADFLETEAHFQGNAKRAYQPRPTGPVLNFDKAIHVLDKHVAELGAENTNAFTLLRRQIYDNCVAASHFETGLFTLSAPTGSGKTLAMLAFALHHARRHGLRRIVIVVPFINIIDQTAKKYRDLFSVETGFDPHCILEHHSLAGGFDDTEQDDGSGEKSYARLLAENWDAPIILTTSVQCLESLMAYKPSRCRKLHRLAKSVILFDEVQTLPPDLAKSTLATLSRLSDPAGPFKASVVFATATQPAFEVLGSQVRKLTPTGWAPTEMAKDVTGLFQAAAPRVKVLWRHKDRISLNLLGDELAKFPQVLAIVNLKRHAAELAKITATLCTQSPTFHLSTNMCPDHRMNTLKSVRNLLEEEQPIRLIATQCVEAGVDIDFPSVYRAFAPLEAICQAAGRCNRNADPTPGQVVVFQVDDDKSQYPPGYKEAVGATETFLNGLAKDHDLNAIEIINDPLRLAAYYRTFYGLQGRADTELADERDLHEAIRAGDFAEVDKLYKLIRQDAINIVVPYNQAVYESLRADSENTEVMFDFEKRRRWLRKATLHAVSLYRPKPESPVWNHLQPIQFHWKDEPDNQTADWFIALKDLKYDPLVGIIPPEESLSIG